MVNALSLTRAMTPLLSEMYNRHCGGDNLGYLPIVSVIRGFVNVAVVRVDRYVRGQARSDVRFRAKVYV